MAFKTTPPPVSNRKHTRDAAGIRYVEEEEREVSLSRHSLSLSLLIHSSGVHFIVAHMCDACLRQKRSPSLQKALIGEKWGGSRLEGGELVGKSLFTADRHHPRRETRQLLGTERRALSDGDGVKGVSRRRPALPLSRRESSYTYNFCANLCLRRLWKRGWRESSSHNCNARTFPQHLPPAVHGATEP